RPGDLVRVLAHEQKAQAHDDFALAIGGDRAAADLGAADYLPAVAHAGRHAPGGANHDSLDLCGVRCAAQGPQQAPLRPVADRPGADVAVVLLSGPNHVVERQTVLDEQVRIDADLILFFVAAPGVDFRRPFYRPHLGANDPIVDRPQLGDVVARPGHDV